MLLQNKTAVVTGTNRGIGRAVLEAFAANGANVYAHARGETPEFAADRRAVSERYGVEIRPLFFDMGDADGMRRAIHPLIKAKTGVDVLVNNAGVAHGGLFSMTKMQTIGEVFKINLFAQMELTQLLLRQMVKNQSGSVINMGSVSGLDLRAGNSAYGVSKAALMAWTKTLAAEVAVYGIRVNAIAPSLTDTDMARQMDGQVSASIVEGSAMKRPAKPSEIADAALFLASDMSSYMTGQVIRVDGGLG